MCLASSVACWYLTCLNSDRFDSKEKLYYLTTNHGLKKTAEEKFDVPMGCYDGAEVCELVGTYILNKFKNVTNKGNIGLYCDDGLGIFQNVPKTEIERKKKQVVKVFKDCGLSITIKCNLKSVDFLDVTFDLINDIYKPYYKPNNKPLYINKHSNHPLKLHQTLMYSTDQLKSTMMHYMKAILKKQNL